MASGGVPEERWHRGHGFRARSTAWPPASTGQGLAVELGCGRKPALLPDYALVGDILRVDWHDFEAVHVQTDLDHTAEPTRRTRWAWAENESCALVICHQALEHFRNLIPVMNEIWRICERGAFVETVVPYGVGRPAIQDPTHVRFFTETTFRYWEPGFVEDFGDYGINGHFAICGQSWLDDGNLWTLLSPLKTAEEVDRWNGFKQLQADGIVRWPAPSWLLGRGPELLGKSEKPDG